MEFLGVWWDTAYDSFNMAYPLVICYIAIEIGHRQFVDLPIKNGGSLQEGNMF